jgi:hypothetical protein
MENTEFPQKNSSTCFTFDDILCLRTFYENLKSENIPLLLTCFEVEEENGF